MDGLIGVERAFREEWGTVVASLIRRFGDWDLAEDAAAEAFAEAARRWPADGLPRRPGAWLTTVATNRALDRLRRGRRGAELLEQVGREANDRTGDTESLVDGDVAVEDERLALIFTCCHPALSMEARVALTLRMLGGLSTAEVARGFLVEEATMAKRLTRAKAKIAAARIPYRTPEPGDLPERLAGVLAVLYLMFNEGYLAAGREGLVRVDLCAEAIRLGELLARLLPTANEVWGLLALMRLGHARRAARAGADGELVRLPDQDRSLWDRELIVSGEEALGRAWSGAADGVAVGAYAIQAAIAAEHLRPGEPDWARVAELYAALAERSRSPVVTLNRAVAAGLAGDLDDALAELAALEAAGDLAGYHLLAASQAELLWRAGRLEAARERFRVAVAQAPEGPERRFLIRQLERLDGETARREAAAGP